MENKHFISLSISSAELETLDEPALSAQVAFWAHMIDRLLFAGKVDASELGKQLEHLEERLDVFSRKYDTGSSFYHWADRIRGLCRDALDRPLDFAYPAEPPRETAIPDEQFERLLKSRRSIREFTGEPVPEETIRKLLECASWAPSSCNMQGLRYLVIRSDEAKDRIHRNCVDIRNANAACVVAVLADLRAYCDGDIECTCHDAGAAIQNMLLACQQYGLGACYISDTGLDGPKFRSLIPVLDHEKVTALVAIGHYRLEPMAPGRVDVSKVTRFC